MIDYDYKKVIKGPCFSIHDIRRIVWQMKNRDKDNTWIPFQHDMYVSDMSFFSAIMFYINEGLRTKHRMLHYFKKDSALDDADKMYRMASLVEFRENVNDLLCPVMLSDSADFDDKNLCIYMPDIEDYESITQYAHDLFMAAAYAVGHRNLLNLPGVCIEDSSEDDQMREQFVCELATACMCGVFRIPSSVAPSTIERVEDFQKYMEEDNRRIEAFVKDVNKTVAVLVAIVNGVSAQLRF